MNTNPSSKLKPQTTNHKQTRRNSMKMYRQGDVLIVKINEFPKEVEAKLKVVKDLHLAEGEVTGHFHCLKTDVQDAIAAEHGNQIFFQIEENARVTHQEH